MNLYKMFNTTQKNERIVSGSVTSLGDNANTYNIRLSDGLLLKNVWSRINTLTVGMSVVMLHNRNSNKYVVIDRSQSSGTTAKEVRI